MSGPRRVLLLGGNRFLGIEIVYRLLAQGDRVTLVSRGQRPNPVPWSVIGERVESLRADRTTDELDRVLAGRRFDATVDLCAYSRSDVERVARVLGERAGHYVFISTGQVYLVRDNCPRPSRERDYDGALIPKPAEDPDLGQWEYGMGKREAEDFLARESGMRVTRIRIPVVNGELDHHRRTDGYLYRLLDGGPLLVPRPDAIARHVYGACVARAIAQLLGNEVSIGKAYNLAQDEQPTVLAVIEKLRDAASSRSELVPVAVTHLSEAGLVPSEVSPFSTAWMSVLDPSLAVRELGFVHAHLDAYLSSIVQAFFARIPNDPPEPYARRAQEIAVARAHMA